MKLNVTEINCVFLFFKDMGFLFGISNWRWSLHVHEVVALRLFLYEIRSLEDFHIAMDTS